MMGILRTGLSAAVLILGLTCLPAGRARAADENPLQGLKISGEAYVRWDANEIQGDKSNAVTLERAYLTVTKAVTDFLGIRYTLDIKQASTSATSAASQAEGDQPITITTKVNNGLDGNYVFRTKYIFAEMNLARAGFFSDARARVGMQQSGLDDFEVSINPYRAQTKNWLERAGWFGTSDLGVGLIGSFGGHLQDAAGRVGATGYDGRYGSYALLLSNGSNYDKKEANDSKVVSGRATVRPFPDELPGLQFTYTGAVGKDNTTNGPSNNGVDFNLNVGMVSYQAPRFTVYGQYITSQDNQAGTFVTGSAPLAVTGLTTQGYSAFGMVKLPIAADRLAIYGRYNALDSDKDNKVAGGKHDVTSTTGGVSYDIAKGNMFIVAYDVIHYDPYAGLFTDGNGSLPSRTAQNLSDDKRLEVVYRLAF